MSLSSCLEETLLHTLDGVGPAYEERSASDRDG